MKKFINQISINPLLEDQSGSLNGGFSNISNLNFPKISLNFPYSDIKGCLNIDAKICTIAGNNCGEGKNCLTCMISK